MQIHLGWVYYGGKAVSMGAETTSGIALTLCTILNGVTIMVNMKLKKTWVYAIQWDLKNEEFLIQKPKSVLGGV